MMVMKEVIFMKMLLSLVLSLALLIACIPAVAEPSGKTAADYVPTLAELAANRGFKIGICLSPNQLSDKTYLEILSTQFKTASASAAMC